MQVNPNYGIIIDTQAQILDEYTQESSTTFTDANNPDDPIYMLNYAAASADYTNQVALQILWNCLNSNTAQGLGLDILCDTILNLTRKGLVPSVAVVDVTVANLISVCTIEIDVTVASPKTLPIGWDVSGAVSPSPAYALLAAFDIPISGIYSFPVYSTDTTTAVPIAAFNAGAAVSGVTFNSVTNPSPAVLGSLTITPDWFVTASSITNSPKYSPNQNYIFNVVGTREILVYSPDIHVNISIGQLNTPSNNFGGQIISVTNTQSNILGTPIETDALFSARRRYYLNIAGQTYYGLEKAILNLNVPALRSVFAPEFISNEINQSSIVVQLTIAGASGGSPVVVPLAWAVTTTTVTTFPYKTLQSFSFTTNGTHYVQLFSQDITTVLPIGDVIAGDVVVGVTTLSNVTPSIAGTSGLGQRGYKVYLDYPTLNTGFFDTSDLYLKLIAQTCFNYHPFGTNFYGGVTGSTDFTVQQSYSGYTSIVTLNPMVFLRTSVVLLFNYTTDPNAAGFAGQIFPVSKIPTLKQDILNIINNYFRSKTLPTDLTYSINELSALIQETYTGIISLSNFTFGLPLDPLTGLFFLTRPIGTIFEVNLSDFSFTATDVA